MLTTQLALVMQCTLLQLGLWSVVGSVAGKHLLIGESLQQHRNFSPRVDAMAQVLLQPSLGLNPRAAHLALLSNVGSEK